MRKYILLFSSLMIVFSAHAQSRYSLRQDLKYKPETRLVYFGNEKNPYTGFVYYLSPQNAKDTFQLEYYRGGNQLWMQRRSNGKLAGVTRNYYDGLKNDSICYESFGFDLESGDTLLYEVHFIGRDKIKWGRQLSWYSRNEAFPHDKKSLRSVRPLRFFTAEEAKVFSGYNQVKPADVDSTGYTRFWNETGIYSEYYPNGKLKIEGRNYGYEFQLAHHGSEPSYPAVGKFGTWKYYRGDGTLESEMTYDENGMLTGSKAYTVDGKISGATQYQKPASEIHLPPASGISIAAKGNVNVVTTRWNENGSVWEETFIDENGNRITYGYYDKGKPRTVSAVDSHWKPFGIHKEWSEDGKISLFINYSDEGNDTLSYTANEGELYFLNLKSHDTKIATETMPTEEEYPNGPEQYLQSLVSIHREYFPNGKPAKEVNLKNGLREGLYREWYNSGVLKIKANYLHDSLDGDYFEYYPTGKAKKYFVFKQNIRNGTCREYYGNGAIKWQNTYINGIPGKPFAMDSTGKPVTKTPLTYFSAFYPDNAIRNAEYSLFETALIYYDLDRTHPLTLTVPDSVWMREADYIAAAFNATNENFLLQVDPNAEEEAQIQNDKLHRSWFDCPGQIYSDSLRKTVETFLRNNDMRLDSVGKRSEEGWPCMDCIRFYYSSAHILVKPLVVDSLNGFMFSKQKIRPFQAIDDDYPGGYVIGESDYHGIEKKKGYTLLMMGGGSGDCEAGCIDRWYSYYVIYDDLSCDFVGTKSNSGGLRYWLGDDLRVRY